MDRVITLRFRISVHPANQWRDTSLALPPALATRPSPATDHRSRFQIADADTISVRNMSTQFPVNFDPMLKPGIPEMVVFDSMNRGSAGVIVGGVAPSRGTRSVTAATSRHAERASSRRRGAVRYAVYAVVVMAFVVFCSAFNAQRMARIRAEDDNTRAELEGRSIGSPWKFETSSCPANARRSAHGSWRGSGARTTQDLYGDAVIAFRAAPQSRAPVSLKSTP